MSMHIQQGLAAVGSGVRPHQPARAGKKSLESLSTGFKIDSGPENPSRPDQGQTARSRTVSLEQAARSAAQSSSVQALSQSYANQRNESLVRERARSMETPQTGNGNGKLDAYA